MGRHDWNSSTDTLLSSENTLPYSPKMGKTYPSYWSAFGPPVLTSHPSQLLIPSPFSSGRCSDWPWFTSTPTKLQPLQSFNCMVLLYEESDGWYFFLLKSTIQTQDLCFYQSFAWLSVIKLIPTETQERCLMWLKAGEANRNVTLLHCCEGVYLFRAQCHSGEWRSVWGCWSIRL